ncbi:MAG: PepSY domain-containing protein [Rhodospirillales bacterium]|nr:PepSY domain-containing protein [Alphaproteobacteria bacterium]MCB9976886.1 PepSY domain-containing protein [Rhodospirillales bacterium]
MKNYVFFGLMALGMLGFEGASLAKEVTANLSEAQAKEKLLESYSEAEILKSKLEEEGGIPVYAFEIKTKDGQMLEVELNGDTGSILEVEGIDKDD